MRVKKGEMGGRSLAQLDKLKLTAYMGPKFSLPKIDWVHVHNLIQNIHSDGPRRP